MQWKYLENENEVLRFSPQIQLRHTWPRTIKLPHLVWLQKIYVHYLHVYLFFY